tara:strand:+ start:704 stop:1162 length:459 start_codon:yes stop_codon:yes gene_type:complete
MKKINNLQELSGVMYTGNLSHKQIPTTSVVNYTRLSSTQKEMYDKLMIGLNLYTKEELYTMNSSKKNKIFKRSKQVQSMLNIWKQQLLIAKTNPVFEIFTNSNISKEIVNVFNQTDAKFLCKLKFKELGITKDKIVHKLIAENFLPANFASL